MRGLASWYLKGPPSSRIFKNEMSQMNTLEDLENILRQFIMQSKNTRDFSHEMY